MRISDWSSDVCSSDLKPGFDSARDEGEGIDDDEIQDRGRDEGLVEGEVTRCDDPGYAGDVHHGDDRHQRGRLNLIHHLVGVGRPGEPHRTGQNDMRSEEHTSELQSLMRISYAVFCLKKKKYKNALSATVH